jgi:hypothetical protein
MSLQKLKIRAWRNFSDFESVNLAILGEEHTEDGPIHRININDKFEAVRVDTSTFQINPTIVLAPKEAQDLVNDLWDAGIRPIAAKGSSGQLEAVEKHLKDMRHIAFDKLDVKLPESV